MWRRALLLALLPLVGCGPKEVTTLNASAPEPTVPTQWQLHNEPRAKASIAAPIDWRTPQQEKNEMAGGTGQVETDPNSILDMGGSAAGSLPPGPMSVSPTFEEPRTGNALVLRKKGMVGETSFPTRITVEYETVAGGTSLAEQAKKVEGKFPGLKSSEQLSLAIGPVQKLVHRVKSRDGETGTIVSYVVVDKEDVWNVRFQTEQDQATVTSVCDQVMETFRPLK
ncbi:MAG: hypothetical protein KIT11_10140 [Fimbriimonadaceae bacterium]|nr:hypothetical protein [Fimbriimonadaceae bacterium]QYK55683.1 MAG: hypothetical protein KF733_11810 [Fimbriimonadaceae bacterium]